MHSKTDNSTLWPDLLAPAPRAHLEQLLTAHAEASAAWKRVHPRSHQDAIPHNDFLRLLGVDNKTVSPTVLSRLISEKGYPGNAENYLAILAAAVEQWRMGQAFSQKAPDGPVYVMEWWAEIEEAALQASAMEEQGIQERGVVFLAQTGHGKTVLARHLKKRIGRATIISARGSWRSSLFAVLSSILTALGQPVPPSARLAELALFKHLNDNKLTLIFDEQDLLGRDALNLIRALLNETRTTVVLLMIPATWDGLVRNGGDYAAQLCRRCNAVVKCPAITPKQAAVFLAKSLPGTPDHAIAETAKVLAREANLFGGFSLLDNCSAALRDLPLSPGETLAEKAAQVARFYRQRHQSSDCISAAGNAA